VVSIYNGCKSIFATHFVWAAPPSLLSDYQAIDPLHRADRRAVVYEEDHENS